MIARYDLLVPRDDEKTGKTYFTKIGAMFPSKSGDGFSIVLDALPIGNRLIARPPLPPKSSESVPF